MIGGAKMKTVYVVEYVAQDGSEQGVSAAFSSWEKANEYISSRLEDKEMIEALGFYDYIITEVNIDEEVAE